MALAAYIACFAGDYGMNGYYSLGAGVGKSRILAAAAVMMCRQFKNVFIVTVSAKLMERDLEDYKSYFTVCDVVDRIHHSSSLPTTSTQDDAVIVDEGDYYVFEQI